MARRKSIFVRGCELPKLKLSGHLNLKLEDVELEAESKNTPGKLTGGVSRVPDDSPLYSKIIPIVIVGLAAIAAIIVLAAVGILIGILPV